MPHNSAEELGIPIGTIVSVTLEGRTYSAVTIDGTNVADKIQSYALRNAYRSRKALLLVATKNGTAWRQVPQVEFDKAKRGDKIAELNLGALNIGGEFDYRSDQFDTHQALVDFISSSYALKPRKLKISEANWKFAVRDVLRAQNLLVVGPSGSGKTTLANALKVALGLESKFFHIDLGAAQDPRSTLVGNTHYDPARGTYVATSEFIEGIQIPGALILIDEVSRGGADATNLLMAPLDATRRYMRIDEMANHPMIRVAPGVSFILTANVGAEYTGTRTMDRALLDRCDILEMDPIGETEEIENLTEMFPEVESDILKAIVSVADATRKDILSASPKVNTIVSTRMAEKWAQLVYDGFGYVEASQIAIIPYFDNSGGGGDTPRSHVLKLIQRNIPTRFRNKKTVFTNADPDDDPNKGAKTPWN